ncbi:MAG: hypothetical protein DME14_17350, partial [Candidatus Rokuibacteriota bacterium]
MGIDWTALGEEAVDLLRRYLMIDTTNPPGNEIDDDRVEVTVTGEPKAPNLSPPDTELYKALADAIRRRAPGAVVVPEILVGFTDNWVFRRCGLHGYGWSPFILDFEGEWHRVHGNDERLSLE